jgi:branched-chain amino acid transport system ATP-binding protein
MAPTITPDSATPMLAIRGLTKYFGGLRAVSGFDLAVRGGDLAGLIGPNGAGKTTVFNMISGLYSPLPATSASRASPPSGWSRSRSRNWGSAGRFRTSGFFPT